jgi:hypothetical protein
MNTSVHHPDECGGVVEREFYLQLHPDEEEKSRQVFEQYGFSNVQFLDRHRLIVRVRFGGCEFLSKAQREFLETF